MSAGSPIVDRGELYHQYSEINVQYVDHRVRPYKDNRSHCDMTHWILHSPRHLMFLETDVTIFV